MLVSLNPSATPKETAHLSAPASGVSGIRRHLWILAVWLVYFLTLSATLVYKHHDLLNDWPFDQAYVIQQFHNWKSDHPKVTIQPGDLRSGPAGEKPFEENHIHRIYAVFKAIYWIWPNSKTPMLVYAFLVSLSVVTLYLFLNQLFADRLKIFLLVLCWMLYPLQQKIAVYTYCSPLGMTATFYFFYLYLLCRKSPFAIVGCLGLLLPREEAVLLIVPTILLFPRKWKILLFHLACMLPFLLFSKSGTGGGDPFAYASASYHPSFIPNFLLTQTILWALVLVNPTALVIAAGFMVAAVAVGAEIYFRFPYEYLGEGFAPPGGFYYYGLLMPPLMAAIAIGIAKLKPNQNRRRYLSLALLLVPGIAYLCCQARYLGPKPEARMVQAFLSTHVAPNAVVVTDDLLSAAFAHRDQIYVYYLPPKGVSVSQVFSLAEVAVIPNVDTNEIESQFMRPSGQRWQRIMESENYVFYKKAGGG